MTSPSALKRTSRILPGLFIDALAPISTALFGERMPVQIGSQWLSIVPIAASRSSYDGLVVFVFIAMSGMLAAFAIHRLASDRLRPAPAWDCGYPDPSQFYDAMFGKDALRNAAKIEIPGYRELVDATTAAQDQPARKAAFAKLQRFVIEQATAQQIAGELMRAFDEFCAKSTA